MAITIPKKIEKLSHGGVVKALLKANKGFTVPSRTEWPKHVPDLVYTKEKITVEVEMTDLEKGWGQCLSYYRLGSEQIHLILPPKLYQQFLNDEKNYVVRNPIPNIEVHKLPVVKRTKRRGRPAKTKIVTKKLKTIDPKEKFYSQKQKPFSRISPWEDKEQEEKYIESLYEKISVTKKDEDKDPIPETDRKRGRPKSKSYLLPKSTPPCKYCHNFDYEGTTFRHCLACGRLI